MDEYELIDSGDGQKIEKFGSYIIQRPCLSAPWSLKVKIKPDATFTREPKGKWQFVKRVPSSWIISYKKLKMKISPTDFGHLGIFPEHQMLFDELESIDLKGKKILNLFAYTGFASIQFALKGAEVVHLDASKPAVLWAKENAALNGDNLSIRFIIDDVLQFLKKEIRRKNTYDGIILDPPSFGRGPKGQLFKIEKDFIELMRLVKGVLSKGASFVALSSHTPGFLPTTLKNMLEEIGLKNASVDEMVITSKKGRSISVGCLAIWKK